MKQNMNRRFPEVNDTFLVLQLCSPITRTISFERCFMLFLFNEFNSFVKLKHKGAKPGVNVWKTTCLIDEIFFGKALISPEVCLSKIMNEICTRHSILSNSDPLHVPDIFSYSLNQFSPYDK